MGGVAEEEAAPAAPIQVKFDPNTPPGYKPVNGTPTVTYLFQTSLNGGAAIPSSGVTIQAAWKK
jgi:hypothetical protein